MRLLALVLLLTLPLAPLARAKAVPFTTGGRPAFQSSAPEAPPAPAQSGQANVPVLTAENEPCTLLTHEEYEALTAGHFLKRRVPTWQSYKRYRASVELIEYNGLLSTRNPVFTMPRNVTDQDAVYLRLRGNTYAYSYMASWTASDLTRGDLMNVIGTSPTQGIFHVQTAEAATRDATQNADNAAQATGSAGLDPAFSALTVLRDFIADVQDTRPGGADPSWLADMERRTNDAGGLDRILRHRAQVQNALDVTVDDFTLAAALVELEARLGELRLTFASVAVRTLSNPGTAPDVRALDKALTGAEFAALRLPKLMATLRATSDQVRARLDRDLPLLRASLESIQEDLRAARETMSAMDVRAAGDAVRELFLVVADLEEAGLQMGRLTTNVERSIAALDLARTEIGRFKEAGRQSDLCTSVGRFRDQAVKVTITATPVARPGLEAAATRAADTTDLPPASVALVREGTFDVRAGIHAHVKIGPMMSRLQNPEFGLRAIDGECPPERQCYKPYVIEPHGQQVGAAVHVALLFPARYFWTDPDPGDHYENARHHRFLPYVTFGFPSTEASDGVLLGGGIDLGRGVSFLAGWHVGKVRRLATDYRVVVDDGLMGRLFDLPTGAPVVVADVIDTDWNAALYFSLSIDAATLGRVLNLEFGGRR